MGLSQPAPGSHLTANRPFWHRILSKPSIAKLLAQHPVPVRPDDQALRTCPSALLARPLDPSALAKRGKSGTGVALHH